MSKVELASVADALTDLESRGFREVFEPAGERVRARSTGKEYPADEIVIVQVHRFEGETDPADMSVVYGLETADGLRGTIIDAYGAYGSSEVGDALKRLKLHEPRAEVDPRQLPALDDVPGMPGQTVVKGSVVPR